MIKKIFCRNFFSPPRSQLKWRQWISFLHMQAFMQYNVPILRWVCKRWWGSSEGVFLGYPEIDHWKTVHKIFQEFLCQQDCPGRILWLSSTCQTSLIPLEVCFSFSNSTFEKYFCFRFLQKGSKMGCFTHIFLHRNRP